MNAETKSVSERMDYLGIVDDLPEEKKKFFMLVVDQLVCMSDTDPELKEGIKYIDEKAHKQKISFYDMVYKIVKETENDRDGWKKDLTRK